MVVWLIIFALALVCLAGMLVWRARQIRQGNVPAEPHPGHPHLDLDTIGGQAVRRARRYGHEAVVMGLRAWVHGAYEVKKQKEKILPRLRAKFHEIFKHHAYLKGQDQPVSKFLHGLNNYKKRLQKIKEKIKEDLHKPEDPNVMPP